MTAMVTPFVNDGVDEVRLREQIEFQIRSGTSALVPCGTTGESATLSHEEHERVVELVVQTTAGRIPVIAGTGSNNTREAIRLTKHAESVGADAVLLIAPYYNRPTQEGLYQHYRAVSEAVDLPIILYNIQSRTGVNIEPETVARLAELENIVGIKEASGNLDQMSRVIQLTRAHPFALLSGDDALTLPVLAIGGTGVISVLSNIMPREVSQLVELFRRVRIVEARELHYDLLPIVRALFLETNPVPVKRAMHLLGMVEPEVRLPLCPMTDANVARLQVAMTNAGLV